MYRQVILLFCITILCYSASAQRKKENKQISEEEYIQQNFPVRTPSRWVPGERFVFVNPQLNITIKPEKPVLHDTTNYQNNLFIFESFKEQSDWSGNSTLDLIFSSNGKKFRFETGKSLTQFSDTTYNPLIPGLIWLSEIERADSLLKDQTLYILTSEWQAEDDSTLLHARKFIPVKITGVQPGDEFSPVRINFQDHADRKFYILTTLSGTLNSSSRLRFPKIFSFTNPRMNHKDISDENWELITRGQLANGMIQSEVRLSIGKPSEINRIPTYSGLREQWLYNSGTMIQFQDGRITSFRR